MQGFDLLAKVAAVVVHHRNYSSVADVVEAILAQGIRPENLLVVDNSEEPEKRSELRQALNSEVELVFTSNLGYGAAVNHAIDAFSLRDEKPDFLLVSTHEAQPSEGAVRALWETLAANDDAAVAGPTLVSGESENYIWSTGGYVDSVTGIPAHHDHRSSLEAMQNYTKPEPREWLDGAFLLYRWEDIYSHRMHEHYFLYMEETDLHLSLRRLGREIMWVPKAKVWQDSRGIPPYYFSRNIRLFLKAHGGNTRYLFIPTLAVGRKILADLVRGRGVKNISAYLRGLTARLPKRSGGPSDRSVLVQVINPLGGALHHYEKEIASVLEASGASVRAHRIFEPSANGKNPLHWVFTYLKALVHTRLSMMEHSKALVLWPVLGYFDVVILSVLGFRDISLVIHDPDPLVKSVGYSTFAKRFAALLGNNVTLIAHSEKAEHAILKHVPDFAIEVLPHPILTPAPSEAVVTMERPPKVRVLGQYKADRDLQVLVELGKDLSHLASLEVYGRGWPDIPGWKVVEGFVSEERLDELMAESAAVVIPYKRFFQSGIAVRALESGTPFVGPKDSVLAEMVGRDSPLLVEEGSVRKWSMAVQHALQSGAHEAARTALEWRLHNVNSWSAWTNVGNTVSSS